MHTAYYCTIEPAALYCVLILYSYSRIQGPGHPESGVRNQVSAVSCQRSAVSCARESVHCTCTEYRKKYSTRYHTPSKTSASTNICYLSTIEGFVVINAIGEENSNTSSQ